MWKRRPKRSGSGFQCLPPLHSGQRPPPADRVSASLDRNEFVALVLDGKTFAEDTIHRGGEAFLVALGVNVCSEKMALGFRQGSSENHQIDEALFRDLARRGLALSRWILFLTDGGSGLLEALREWFGNKLGEAVPQRS